MRWIVGIDEVGRGALAGPVVVAAAALPRGRTIRNASLGTLRDSKKLTPKQREAWVDYLCGTLKVSYALARVYPRQIEKRNISKAANLAALRAFRRLPGARSKPGISIFLDGGLFLGGRLRQEGSMPNAKTIVKGDEKITAIKIASIIAKVHRDRLMRKLSRKHQGYGFEVHKGYATQMHRDALRAMGPCVAHRLTFVGKSSKMKEQ